MNWAKRRDQRSATGVSEAGFTLVELMVAMTIIAGLLVAMTYVLTGALTAYAAAYQRSSMVELANGHIEAVRGLPYGQVGVLTTDSDYAAAYPGNQHQGRDAVDVPAGAPSAVEVTPQGPGVPVPVTVRRWITWTDTTGGATHKMKRVDVQLEWNENGRAPRSLTLSSIVYPGGFGTTTTAPPALNQTPTASFTYSPATPAIGSPVTFTSTSYDPDTSDTLTYLWIFPSGTATTATPTYTFTASGSQPVQLQVNDGRGGIDTKTTTVNVAASNLPPTAAFSVTTPLSGRPDVVTVDASASNDPEGATLSYLWTFGDGGTQTGKTATHRYLTTGTRPITLTVTDAGGATDSATQSHTVSSVGCTVISASFKNPTTNTATNSIRVDTQHQRAIQTSFSFTAQTTLACTSLRAYIPDANGQDYRVDLSFSSNTTTKSWTGAGSSGNNAFNLGTAQTAYFKSPATTGVDDTFPIAFSVTP